MNVCVYGAASDKIDKIYVEEVEKLGREIAKRGHNLVFGAGGTGLMGAAARGVHEGGGEITGVIPTFFLEQDVEIVFPECDKVIYTKDMRDRKEKMEELADAFVMVPGGIGTFEEFFEILTAKQLEQHKKCIAVYDINGYFDELEKMMEHAIETHFVNDKCRDLYKLFKSREELFDYIENYKGIDWGIEELKK